MATVDSMMVITRPSAGDLSTKINLFVEMDTNGKVAACETAGDGALGVLQNNPSAADQAATVAFAGVTKVVAGATVATNAKVSTDNAGKAITAASGHHVLGRCVKGGAVNELIEVILLPQPVLA